MKRLFFFALLGFTVSAFSQEKPIVVVELFTSEGCSSCPPADRLLSSIVNETHNDAEVLGLSFHVDYWDYIGWKDPYSEPQFSKRQRIYAQKLYSTVYTPQMVVNGTHRFVGSNRSEWKKTLQKEKSADTVQPLNVSNVELNGRNLYLKVDGVYGKSLVNVAVIERGLSQQVNRGENRGRILEHDNVVRAFDSKKSDAGNSFELILPEDLKLSNSSVVVYSQNQASWQITAAKKIALSSVQ